MATGLKRLYTKNHFQKCLRKLTSYSCKLDINLQVVNSAAVMGLPETFN